MLLSIYAFIRPHEARAVKHKRFNSEAVIDRRSLWGAVQCTPTPARGWPLDRDRSPHSYIGVPPPGRPSMSSPCCSALSHSLSTVSTLLTTFFLEIGAGWSGIARPGTGASAWGWSRPGAGVEGGRHCYSLRLWTYNHPIVAIYLNPRPRPRSPRPPLQEWYDLSTGWDQEWESGHRPPVSVLDSMSASHVLNRLTISAPPSVGILAL